MCHGCRGCLSLVSKAHALDTVTPFFCTAAAALIFRAIVIVLCCAAPRPPSALCAAHLAAKLNAAAQAAQPNERGCAPAALWQARHNEAAAAAHGEEEPDADDGDDGEALGARQQRLALGVQKVWGWGGRVSARHAVGKREEERKAARQTTPLPSCAPPRGFEGKRADLAR